MPLLLLNFLDHVVRIFTNTGSDRWEQAFWAVFSIVLILLALASRLMALKVQDRVIRLEERLRYDRLLGSEMAEKAGNLDVRQIIALRFASDEELPGLVERTLNGEFAKPKDIKLAVKTWRGDNLRV